MRSPKPSSEMKVVLGTEKAVCLWNSDIGERRRGWIAWFGKTWLLLGLGLDSRRAESESLKI